MVNHPARDPPAERLRGSPSPHHSPQKKERRYQQTGTTSQTHSPHLTDPMTINKMSKSPPPSMQDYSLTALIARPQFTSCSPQIRRAWIALWRSVYRTYLDDMTKMKYSNSDPVELHHELRLMLLPRALYSTKNRVLGHPLYSSLLERISC